MNAIVSFQDKCFISVSLQNSTLKALINTGSSISAINNDIIKKLNFPNREILSSEISFITGAGGSNRSVRGKIQLPIKIGDLKIYLKTCLLRLLYMIVALSSLVKYVMPSPQMNLASQNIKQERSSPDPPWLTYSTHGNRKERKLNGFRIRR